MPYRYGNRQYYGHRDNHTPEFIAAGTLLLLGLLLLSGVLQGGNPGPSAEEAKARSAVSATATVRAFQLPRVYPNPNP